MEVANVVASIIAALGNGKELFRKMIGKKGKTRSRMPTLSEKEAWLQESLSRRPREVQTSFNNSVAQHGHKFEKGDSAAQSSLAHTLLVLNSGLVDLINLVLHRDSKYDPMSSQALLHLSDNATRDTLSALNQLSVRLTSLSANKLPERRDDGKDGGKSGRPVKKKRSKHGHTAPIARGAWIRSTPKPLASAAGSQVCANQRQRSRERKRALGNQRDRQPKERTYGSHGSKKSGMANQHEPGMLVGSSDVLWQDPPSSPRGRNDSHHGLARPLSAATFMTASTKIGEIQPARASGSRQLSDNPKLVKYSAEPSQERDAKPRKLRRGFNFWKRGQESAGDVVH